eukprot:TRINITY_DN5108_c0_g1_i5.p1 TRINITY_DN5108_c0_g1~~TRINITY_DN5108_c0_g1_i5.p1  ORF type:complete len:533 (+),score=100.88 TRINITY_DN5108_c0_g1_i5:187-1599(+)
MMKNTGRREGLVVQPVNQQDNNGSSSQLNSNFTIQAATVNQLILLTIGNCYNFNLDIVSFVNLMDGRFTTRESLILIQNVCFIRNISPGVVCRDSGPISLIKLHQLLMYWITKYHKEFKDYSTAEEAKKLFRWMANTPKRGSDDENFSFSIPESLDQSLMTKYSIQTELFCKAFGITSRDLGFKILMEVLSCSRGWCSLRVLNREMKKIAEQHRPPPSKERFKLLKECNPQEVKLMDLPPKILAEELGIRYINQLRRIHPIEFDKCNWTKKERKSSVIKELIHDSNEFSSWISGIMLEEDPIQRKKNWKWVVQLEKELKDCRNYQSLMTLASSLNSAEVHRLIKHVPFSKQELKIFEEVAELITPKKSYLNLRMAQMNRCVPYLGLFLTDITFIEEGNHQPYHSSPLLDLSFEKLKSQAFSRIQLIRRETDTTDSFPLVQQMIDEMMREEKKSEKELYDLSLNILSVLRS